MLRLDALQYKQSGCPFVSIKWVRYKYVIPHICLAEPDELTVKQLANHLEVSTHIVYYWLERGIVQARKLDGGTWRITLTAAKTQELQDWVRNSGHLQPQHANI